MKHAKRLEKIEATLSPPALPHVVGIRRKGATRVESPDGQKMDEKAFWASWPDRQKVLIEIVNHPTQGA